MKEFRAKAIINAPAKVVWSTITDLKTYPQYDPNCIKIEGSLKKSQRLTIHSKIGPCRAYKMTVTEFRPEELMTWEARLPFNLVKNVFSFSIIAKDDQTTEFHFAETIDGLLYKIFPNKMPDLKEICAQFTKGLKRYIESRP